MFHFFAGLFLVGLVIMGMVVSSAFRDFALVIVRIVGGGMVNGARNACIRRNGRDN